MFCSGANGKSPGKKRTENVIAEERTGKALAKEITEKSPCEWVNGKQLQQKKRTEEFIAKKRSGKAL